MRDKQLQKVIQLSKNQLSKLVNIIESLDSSQKQVIENALTEDEITDVELQLKDKLIQNLISINPSYNLLVCIIKRHPMDKNIFEFIFQTLGVEICRCWIKGYDDFGNKGYILGANNINDRKFLKDMKTAIYNI